MILKFSLQGFVCACVITFMHTTVICSCSSTETGLYRTTGHNREVPKVLGAVTHLPSVVGRDILMVSEEAQGNLPGIHTGCFGLRTTLLASEDLRKACRSL